jgi:diguanylate cyclase (GGDEF)-like protein
MGQFGHIDEQQTIHLDQDCHIDQQSSAPADVHQLAAAQLVAHLAVAYLVVVAERDEARRAQQELARRSLRDQLTGLANRELLFDRLAQALRGAERSGRRVAVFFIDLDGFKQINDTFGHAAGDAVLAESAQRMAATVRTEDTLARLAGDEFVLICQDLPQTTHAELDRQVRAVADRLRQALARPISVGGVPVTVAASIGVALSSPGGSGAPGSSGVPGSSPEMLLAEADAAMYRAKQRHRACVAAHPAGDAWRPTSGSLQARKASSRVRWSIALPGIE